MAANEKRDKQDQPNQSVYAFRGTPAGRRSSPANVGKMLGGVAAAWLLLDRILLGKGLHARRDPAQPWPGGIRRCLTEGPFSGFTLLWG
jgi:hypothetical protein